MPFIVNVQLKESSTLNIFSYETKTFYVRPAREAFYFASFIIAVEIFTFVLKKICNCGSIKPTQYYFDKLNVQIYSD